MSPDRASNRLVLVHDDRPRRRPQPASLRRYRLARVRAARLREPGDLHAHLARMFD